MPVSTSTAPISVANVWRFIEEKIITGAAVTDFDFAAVLAGDTEREYMIVGRVFNTADQWIYLRLNGAEAAGFVQWVDGSGNAMTAARYADCRLINGSNTYETSFQIVLPDTATNATHARQYISNSSNHAGAAANSCDYFGGTYTTPASGDEITSIGFKSGVAGGIGVGSRFALYKRVR